MKVIALHRVASSGMARSRLLLRPAAVVGLLASIALLAALPVRAADPHPDLVIEDLKLGTLPNGEADPRMVKYKIKNVGGEESPEPFAKITFSPQQGADVEQLLRVPKLQPGESFEDYVEFPISCSVATVTLFVQATGETDFSQNSRGPVKLCMGRPDAFAPGDHTAPPIGPSATRQSIQKFAYNEDDTYLSKDPDCHIKPDPTKLKVGFERNACGRPGDPTTKYYRETWLYYAALAFNLADLRAVANEYGLTVTDALLSWDEGGYHLLIDPNPSCAGALGVPTGDWAAVPIPNTYYGAARATSWNVTSLVQSWVGSAEAESRGVLVKPMDESPDNVDPPHQVETCVGTLDSIRLVVKYTITK